MPSATLVALLVFLGACAPPDASLGDDLSGAGSSEASGSEGVGESTETEGDSGEDEGPPVKFDMSPPDVGEPDPPPEFPTTCAEAEENPSSVGCEFYPLALPDGQSTYGSSGFAASNVSAKPATVTLSDVAGQVAQVVLQPGQVHMFEVDATRQLRERTEVMDFGWVIESDEPLQVFGYFPPLPTPTADATVVLPRTALGVKHRAVTYNDHVVHSGDGIHGQQYVAVVAVEDDTKVTFELAAPGSFTLAGDGLPALDKDDGETSLTVTLDRLETLTVAADNRDPITEAYNVELTGSLLTSDKPVATYSGTPPTGLPAQYPWPCCADLIADQLPPTTAWGRDYAAVKLLPIADEPDLWRLMANRDGTEIELSGGVEDLVVLDAGEYYDLLTPESFWASGNHAFAVIHFMVGADLVDGELDAYEGQHIVNVGDPAMVWVYPAGNWLDRYVFPVGPVTFGEWYHDHATVVAPLADWDAITLGGAALPPPIEIGPGYGYGYVPLPLPTYELLAPPGVGVSVDLYGYVHNGSYLHQGGMGLGRLNPAG